MEPFLNLLLRCLGCLPTPQSQTITTSGAANINPYIGIETLLKSVESGAIAVLKGTWLVDLHKRGGRLSRRQDIPPDGFWSADELRKVALALGDDFGVLFVALSYRWLTKFRKGRDPDHPDPDAFHLGIVASVAELYLNLSSACRHGKGYPSQLTAAFRKHGLGDPDFALFWDFGSLHQPPRTDAEMKLFDQGMDLSPVWFGHARTVVWIQPELPEGFEGVAYASSGWCYFEAAISSAMKPGFQRLDLAKRTKLAMECAYGPDEPGNPDAMLACVCARRRPPPPSPEQVRRLLQQEKRFTDPSDWEKVAMLYAAFFEQITKFDALVFQGLKWVEADVVQLCEVLPRFVALRSLDLSKNMIGPEGVKALALCIAVNSSIIQLE